MSFFFKRWNVVSISFLVPVIVGGIGHSGFSVYGLYLVVDYSGHVALTIVFDFVVYRIVNGSSQGGHIEDKEDDKEGYRPPRGVENVLNVFQCVLTSVLEALLGYLDNDYNRDGGYQHSQDNKREC